MNKSYITIWWLFLVLCPLSLLAETMEEQGSSSCELMRKRLGYPYYYCDCTEQSTTFLFPLEDIVSDTVWFKAEVNDLLRGLSAYWFADCAVQMDVYATCASKEPTLTLRVGKNQMHEMDATAINDKLAAMGSAGEALKNIKPRIRVYPIGGGSGKVLCYPYDEGPHSTCTDLLPIYTSMMYVSSHAYDVYELQPATIPARGELFVQWREKSNRPCTVTIRRGSCDGEVVTSATLADSTRLLFLDKTLLLTAKQAGESLYLRFDHDSQTTGRIRVRVPKFITERVDTTVCAGLGLQLPDTLLSATTVYPNDTVWLRQDTVALRTYYLTVTPPPIQYDTLLVRASELPMLYRGNLYIKQGGFGDYDYTKHVDAQCDERYLLHVEHAMQTATTTIDTTLCEGKIYTFAGKNYTRDTDIRDTIWTDPDTRTIVDVRLTFTPPEIEYDTLYLTQAQLQGEDGYGYYHAQSMQYITAYGDIDYTLTARNRCTRRIRLSVLPATSTDIDRIDAVPSKRVRRYNLLGQPVDDSYRGVVIQDGRMLLVVN